MGLQGQGKKGAGGSVDRRKLKLVHPRAAGVEDVEVRKEIK